MKKSIMILLMMFLGFTVFAGEGSENYYNAQHGKLLVEIDGLTTDEGSLKVLLFHSETGYPVDEWSALYALDIEISDMPQVVNFESIPFHEYALFVYHDANSNGKHDKNWAGMAKESYGYSNEASGVRTMPLYSNSVFNFDADGQVMNVVMIDVDKKGNKPQVSKQ